MFELPIDEETKPVIEEEEIVQEEQEEQEIIKEDDESEFLNEYLKSGYDYYKDLGLFEGIEDVKEPKTEQEFLDLLRKKQEFDTKLVQENFKSGVLNTVPDYMKPIVELALNNQLTQEEFVNLTKLSKNESVETEEQAEAFLRKYYKDVEGYSEEELDEEIEGLKLRDKVLDKAKKIEKVEQGKKQKALDAEIATKQKLVQEKAANEEKFFNNLMGSIDNTGWKPSKVNRIKQSVTTTDFTARLENILSNPNALPLLVDLLTYYDGKELHLNKFVEKELNTKLAEAVEQKAKQSYFKPRGNDTNKRIDIGKIDSIELI